MRLLRYDEIDDYLAIEFDAFFDKLGPLYGNRRRSAYRIIKEEILMNLDLGRYMVAAYKNKPVGIIEIVTRENARGYRKSFPSFFKNLGLAGAVRAYFLTLMDMPTIDKSTIYIDSLAVDKDFRNKGIATSMLSYAEYIAGSRGKDRLSLWVAYDNKAAYDFYNKTGFSPMMFRSSRIAHHYMGYRDWVYMRKDLN
jgi:ribosomal protein S18 acetylase RimI-like enzyme